MPQLDPATAAPFEKLSASIRAGIEAAEVPHLDEGPHQSELNRLLANPGSDELIPELSSERRKLCLSGLWLLAGDLDRSHQISQSIGSAEGSFWHGIMHRREGDYGNSKYWFRRVGTHPVVERLSDIEPQTYGDPYRFVDACEQAVTGSPSAASESAATYEAVQWMEWQLLMAHCLAPSAGTRGD